MKRYINLILIVVAFCTVVLLLGTKAKAAIVTSGTCGDNLTWSLNDEGTLVVSGFGTMKNWSSSANAPWYDNLSDIKTVIIEDGVTSLGSYAFFNCSSLTKITIPDSVISIGQSSFRDCISLNDVSMGKGVTSIGDYAFYFCINLSSVNFGENIRIIGNHAFVECVRLRNVFIPDSVVHIGNYAFSGCSNMSIVYFGNGLESIGNYVFDDTSWYNAQENGLVYAGKVAYKYKGLCPSVISIKEGTLGIAPSAFQDCTSLEKIFVPSSVTNIGDNAFYNCASLTAITISDGVNCIGSNAFYRCSSLTSVHISNIASWCGIVFKNSNANPLSYAKSLYLNGQLVTDIVLPDGIASIGSYVFYNCNSLTSITIPDNATCIGSYSFYNCNSLTSITIPNNVTSIGSSAFSGCVRLTEINFNSIKMSNLYQNNNVFYGAGQSSTGIKVIIGERVTRIPSYLFCPNSSNISSSPKVVSIEFADGGVCSTIGNYAFSNCLSLTSVTIAEYVQNIGMYAFYNCTGITEIRFNAISLDDLYDDSYTFAMAGKSSGGIKVIVGKKVTKIPMNLFVSWDSNSNCNISTVEFETESVCKTVGVRAFFGCKNLKSIILPESLKNVELEAFSGCGLSSVVLPKNTTYIGPYVFAGDSILTSITFEGVAPTIDVCAFQGVTAFVYYSLSESWMNLINQNYGGSLTWCSVCLVEVNDKSYTQIEEAILSCGERNCIVLKSNIFVDDVSLSQDLYIDFNGWDMRGRFDLKGHKIYGMDSTTDDYTYDDIGYFNCVDENGEAIIPENHFKSDITGSIKRYMTIRDENGYSFHRFYLGITHQTLRPTTTGVGYKAVFYGDEMVMNQLNADNAFGFTMQLEGNSPVSVYKDRDSFVSGKTITLRIDNFDVEHYGESVLTAKVMLQLSDGTVIESTECIMTMRSLLETINDMTLTTEQLTAIRAMIEKFAIIKTWDTENLYT